MRAYPSWWGRSSCRRGAPHRISTRYAQHVRELSRAGWLVISGADGSQLIQQAPRRRASRLSLALVEAKGLLPAPECRFPRLVASGLESGATHPAPAGVVDEPGGLRAVNCALSAHTLPAHTSARYFLRSRAGRRRDGDAKIRRHRSSPNAVSRRLFDRLGPARSWEPSPGPAKSRHLNAADPPSRPVDGGVDDPHQFPGPARHRHECDPRPHRS